MRWLPLLMAFGAGAATVLTFAPFSQAWIAPLSLLLLFKLWHKKTPRQAAIIGFAYGLGLMGFGIFWLHNSIAQFGGLNLPLAIGLTLLFAAVLALFYALSGWLSVRISGSPLITFPAVWVLLEWLRSWLLTGFPWLSLGYSQIDFPLAGYAPLLGVYGISFMLALSAVLLLNWRSFWILLLPAIWLAGWMLQGQNWTDKKGTTFQASLIQGNIPQEIKWKSEQLRDTLTLYTQLTDKQTESQLIVWPETAVPVFAKYMEEDFLQPLHKRFETEQKDLLLGIPVLQDDGRYYNAMLSLGYSGRHSYYKQHLVPFGEFMPLQFILKPLAKLFNIPMSAFSPGTQETPVIPLAGYQAGISICYEDTFGVEIAAAIPMASFLVNASNDAWFGDSLAPDQHLEMARMRALETGRYMLRATNTGISAITDEKGRIISSLAQFKQGVVSAQVQPMQGSTLFAQLGNWSIILWSILLLGLSLLTNKIKWKKDE